MARVSRAVVPGFPHHVTQRGVRSLPIFRDDADRKIYLAHMAEQCARFGVDVLAWCLMSNHIHIVALPSRQDSLALGIGEAHRRYTRHINFAVGVRGHLFQERFHSCPMDEEHLLAAARYTELNPVAAGMVKRAEDWDWSSARFHLQLMENDPLVKDPSLMGLIPPGRWPELLQQAPRLPEQQLLRHVRTGRPAGDKNFVRRVEKMTGLKLTQGKAGRPPVSPLN